MEDQTGQQVTNPSSGLDLATVFESYGMTAGMEAMEVQAILELDGIPAVIVSTIMYPSLPYQVRVPKDHVEQALIRIAEAQARRPIWRRGSRDGDSPS
jgi:hypothetical protein